MVNVDLELNKKISLRLVKLFSSQVFTKDIGDPMSYEWDDDSPGPIVLAIDGRAE